MRPGPGSSQNLIIWSLDRLVREGPEDALRILRQFSERGCTILSVKESPAERVA